MICRWVGSRFDDLFWNRKIHAGKRLSFKFTLRDHFGSCLSLEFHIFTFEKYSQFLILNEKFEVFIKSTRFIGTTRYKNV